MLKLIYPTLKYKESVRKAAFEYKENPSPFDLGQIKRLVQGLDTDFDTYLQEYIATAEKSKKTENIPEGISPMTTFWLIKDQNYIGVFDVRHILTDSLKISGGNIGYEIIPSERGKGMAKTGLRLLLQYCHDVLKLEKVLITCNVANIASYNTMKSLMNEYGGFEDTQSSVNGKISHRIWITTSKTVSS